MLILWAAGFIEIKENILNKKIIIGGLVVVIALVGGANYYPKISNLLYTANGFSAKNICSGHFISGFSSQSVLDEALKPLDDAFALVDFTVNEQEQAVKADIFGLFSRKAIYNQGIGCTLLAIGQDKTPLKVKLLSFTQLENDKNIPWPEGAGGVNEDVAGIDYNLLTQAISQAFVEPDEKITRRTKAVAVIYKGQLIAEKYAQGVDQNTSLLSWSMAKSITNLQVGLLVKDKKLKISDNANVPIWHSDNGQRNSTQHQQITLDELLRMSSGLEFHELYGGASDAPYMLSIAPSASDFAADKPVIHQPDTFWAYSSGTTNIISAIVKRTISGDFQQYYEYTQNKLFKPLNIKSAQLEVDAQGTFIGSSYIYNTARDWAKLGQLMLQDGVWHNKRILPEGWVKYSTTPTKTDPLNHYGAQFWLNADPESVDKQRTWPSVPADTYSMKGFQGQYVVTIPSKELVVVRFGFSSPGADKGIEKLLSGVIATIDSNEEWGSGK